jgi:hypothetical protein
MRNPQVVRAARPGAVVVGRDRSASAAMFCQTQPVATAGPAVPDPPAKITLNGAAVPGR